MEFSLLMSKREPIFIRLIYGFYTDDISVLEKPCTAAAISLILIHKELNHVPKEILQIIIMNLWELRSSFVNDLNIYYRPMYSKDLKDELYVGFDYDHISDIFVDSPSIYSGQFRLSGGAPPQEIIDSYSKHFPDLKLTNYALLQNAYTSHYASGNIMYGYYVNYDGVSNWDELHDLFYRDDTVLDLEIVGVDHASSKHKCELFIGITLGSISGVEDCDDAENNAKALSKIYEPVKIPSKQEILKELNIKLANEEINSCLSEKHFSSYPVLTFVPTMCYCCT